MTINEDFENRAETEMKMHDAKMMEQAKLRKLANAPLEERIAFALSKKNNNPEDAFAYMQENHLILSNEIITEESIRNYLKK